MRAAGGAFGFPLRGFEYVENSGFLDGILAILESARILGFTKLKGAYGHKKKNISWNFCNFHYKKNFSGPNFFFFE